MLEEDAERRPVASTLMETGAVKACTNIIVVAVIIIIIIIVIIIIIRAARSRPAPAARPKSVEF